MKAQLTFGISYVWCLLGMIVMNYSSLFCQQIPTSIYQITNPYLFNAACTGQGSLDRFQLGHRHRGGADASGWGTFSSFLNVASGRSRSRGGFGFGLNVTNDKDHTDNRFAFSPSISKALIETRNITWRAGVSFGMLNLSSNFSGAPVYNPSDAVLSGTSFIELDAGAATAFLWKTRWMQGDLLASCNQLLGNPITRNKPMQDLLPHGLAAGGILFEIPRTTVAVGPRFFLKSVLAEPYQIRRGILDLGLKAEFAKQAFWLSASYRSNHSAISAALGMRIWETDSIKNNQIRYWNCDFFAGATFPSNQAAPFGPSMEIGLTFSLARPKQQILRQYEGPIWLNEANLTSHKKDYLNAVGPTGIIASLDSTSSSHILTYEFPDYSNQYAGRSKISPDGSFKSIGPEWENMDAFLHALVWEVNKECLSPDPKKAMYIKRLDSLATLLWIEVRTDLKRDSSEALVGAYDYGWRNGPDSVGIGYYGELHHISSRDTSSLTLYIEYDERTDSVVIPIGKSLNHFQLACLKLYAMQLRLKDELESYYAGENVEVIIESEYKTLPMLSMDGESEERRPLQRIVLVRLKIESDHPKQKAERLTMISLRYKDEDPTKRTSVPSRESLLKPQDFEKHPGKNKRNTPATRENQRPVLEEEKLNR